MRSSSWWTAVAVAVVGAVGVASGGVAQAQGRPGPAAQPVDRTVPSDLRPLLTPRRSEMRLVVTRYQADRTLLGGNYAGAAATQGGGRGRGQQAAPDTALVVPVSPARIARLRRFGLSWQTALARLDTTALSAAA